MRSIPHRFILTRSRTPHRRQTTAWRLHDLLLFTSCLQAIRAPYYPQWPGKRLFLRTPFRCPLVPPAALLRSLWRPLIALRWISKRCRWACCTKSSPKWQRRCLARSHSGETENSTTGPQTPIQGALKTEDLFQMCPICNSSTSPPDTTTTWPSLPTEIFSPGAQINSSSALQTPSRASTTPPASSPASPSSPAALVATHPWPSKLTAACFHGAKLNAP